MAHSSVKTACIASLVIAIPCCTYRVAHSQPVDLLSGNRTGATQIMTASNQLQGTYLVKFINSTASTRYVYINRNAYHTLLSGDTWENTFINVPDVRVCAAKDYDHPLKIVPIDADKVVTINY